MDFPQHVTDITKECAAKHGMDAKEATKCAIGKIRKLPDYGDLVEMLIEHAVLELVYDARHRSNIAMRAAAGQYGTPAKVQSSQSSAIQRVAESLYLYAIGGTVLGNITGEQLPQLAATEAAIAEGHEFNARLCLRLSKLVPKNKVVRDCVSERRLRNIFKELGAGGDSAAA